MKFDLLYEELMKQLELDFSNKPKWAVAASPHTDELLKKYYPIVNMPKGNRRSAAIKKFWKKVMSILQGKGLSLQRMKDLGIPEYILYSNY